MPPFVRFELASPEPIAMRSGTRIDYRIKLRSFSFRWRSEIGCWEPPTRFVDEQLRGPYLRWRHEHRFEARGDHTLVCDDVAYRVPGGRAVHAVFVRPELRRIFACRSAKLGARFGRAGEAIVEGVRKPTR
jgi:ligand-binding SRPBCC domain-containing protein